MTDETIQRYFPIAFPIFFAMLWLVITTLLSLLSGWFHLMRRFPDREDVPIVRLTWQSGRLGIVGMRSLLTLSACKTGLRVGMLRAFGPFSRPFFVPWDQISVERTTSFFMQVAKLGLGKPRGATLMVTRGVVERLASGAGSAWPEATSGRD